MRTRVALALAVWLAAAGGAAAETAGAAEVAAIPLIEITEVQWAQRVDAASRNVVGAQQQARAYTPLVLWMRIHAGEAALNRLETAGRLPIRHRWFRESYAGVSAEGVTEMTDSIALDAGSREKLGALRQEVAARGYFDWRTWSYKARPGPGRWRVAVVYADNTPVMCGSENPQPCRYSITVK